MQSTHTSLGLSLEAYQHFLGLAAAPARFDGRPGMAALGSNRAVLERAAADWAAAAVAEIEDPGRAPARVAALRAELARRGLDGLILPLTDEYQNEYLPLRARRLSWLTGFTGSAGHTVVLADRAAVWSDGRYTLQLRAQVDAAVFTLLHTVDQPVDDWLTDHLRPGQKLGFDPWLHSADGVKRLEAAVAKAGASLVAVVDNPVDTVWTAQPPAPLAPFEIHDLAYAGESSADKRARLAAGLARDGLDAAVLSLPESIAWLLNLRGGDVPHTPLPLSMAILARDGRVDLFVDARKVGADVAGHLGPGVTCHDPAALGAALDNLGASRARVRLDPAHAAFWLFRCLETAGAEVVRGDDPTLLPKACKNAVEIAGARAAHVRDGAAMARFLHWLDGAAVDGTVDELTAMDEIEAFRRRDPLIRDLSFTTIAGSGPNSAIVHYRSTPSTNRPLQPGTIFLLDSGAQYLDGTTDITRTLFVPGGAAPTAEMKDRFTRVLKGHIAIATARFPVGTSGQQLDILARKSLWAAGIDFDHGTGHGIGSYLNVHEGPHRIAKAGSAVPLRPGMIVSNEPGYYKTDAFGIRIENLLVVTERDTPPGGDRRMLGFDVLTLAPIDRRLIDAGLLDADERGWLDAYHARVLAEIGPLIEPAARAWLAAATAPLA